MNSKHVRYAFHQWTETEINRLRTLAEQGLAARIVATPLGRSYSAITNKAHQLAIQFKGIRNL